MSLNIRPSRSAPTAGSCSGPITASARSWIKLKGKLEAGGAIQPGLTLKGLRHTVATILAEMGQDHGTIALVLGHAPEAMAKNYSRRADMTRQATSVFAEFWEELN